jgi:hypothetical protein
MSFDAYTVAVRLSLINGVSAGLASIASQLGSVNKGFAGAQAGANALHRDLLKIQRMGLIGGGMAALGFGGLALMKGPLDAARGFEVADARFKTLNLGATVNKEAREFALATKVFGASNTELMDTLRETYGVFGNMASAKLMAPKLAELNAANSVLFGGKAGKLDDTAIRAIKRFNDMRGLTDSPENFTRGLNLAQRMFTGSGGELKFTDLEALAKRGGTAFKGLSDDGVMMLATVLQEQGGHSTGTGLMSLYQNLVAGRTPKKTMAALSKAGLAELGYVTHGTVGSKDYKTTQIAKIKGEELLRTNPGAWLMEYVVPAAKAAGAKTDSEIIKFANDLVSNRTGSNIAATFTTQGLQALRDFKLVKNAMGVDGTINASKKTFDGSLGNLHAQWKNLMMAVGVTVLPMATRAIESLSSALVSFTKFAKDNPTAIKVITTGFIALTGALAIGGSILLLTAAFKGLGLVATLIGGAGGIPIVGKALGFLGQGVLFLGRALLMNPIGLVITAIAGAVYLLYRNWSTIGPYVMKVWEVIKYVVGSSADWIGAKIKAVWDFAKPAVDFYIKTWSMTFSVVKEGVSAVYDFVSGIMTKLWDMLKNTPIAKALGFVIDKAKNAGGVAVDAAERGATKLYTDAVANNYAASYSNEGRGHFVPPPTASGVNVTVVNKLDKNGLATMVTQEQTKAMARPPAGPSTFDGSMNPRALGSSFAGG